MVANNLGILDVQGIGVMNLGETTKAFIMKMKVILCVQVCAVQSFFRVSFVNVLAVSNCIEVSPRVCGSWHRGALSVFLSTWSFHRISDFLTSCW